ncbi:MAG TPA: FG-GAP-like repeat-containing protein, partial [Verrucomicrobiae bacterium]
RVDYPTGNGPRESAIADLDGDGLPDIANANLSQSSWSVLRQVIPGAPPAAPQITSQPVSQSVALGGSATFTVTASGAELNYQWLFQGGLKAGATSAELIIAGATLADAGDYAVIVSNGGGSVTSSVVTLEVRTDSLFAPRVNFSAESGQAGIALGDLDGDGKPDAVVANYSGTSLSVYRNVSTAGVIDASSFAARVNFPVGATPHHVVLADFDGDGKLDILCVNQGNSLISLLRNTASAGVINSSSFAPKVDLASAADPYWAAVGDFNGDGKADIVVSCYTSAALSVFENHSTAGTFSFGPRVDLGFDMASASVEVGDIDGDGKADIVVAGTSPFIWIHRNVSSGGTLTAASFAARATFPCTSGATVTLADMDGDGKLDLVTPNSGNSTLSLWRNTGTAGTINSGTFAAPVNFPTGAYPYRAVAGDLDGDGRLDLVMANASSHTVSVFRNLSTPGALTSASLAARVDYPTGNGPRESAIADLDGDGLPDIANANLSQSSWSVLRQTGVVTNLPPQLPVIVLQPVPYQSVSIGGSVQLSVIASGTGPLSFQWYFNDSPRSGADAASLVINNVQPTNAGSYRVVVSNLVGSVTSIVAAVNVASNPPSGGTLMFANSFSNRVYDVGGSNLVAAGGTLVVGLWVGADAASLQLSGALATFNASFAPGRFNGGARTIPGTSPGQVVSVQVRVWDSAAGATYDEAVAAGGKSGASIVFQIALGGGLQPPPMLWPMPSFALTLPGLFASPLPAPAPPPASAQLTSFVRSADGWTLTIQGSASATCAIQASTDFIHWTTIAYVLNERGVVDYTDTDTSAPARFYRVQVISD